MGKLYRRGFGSREIMFLNLNGPFGATPASCELSSDYTKLRYKGNKFRAIRFFMDHLYNQ